MEEVVVREEEKEILKRTYGYEDLPRRRSPPPLPSLSPPSLLLHDVVSPRLLPPSRLPSFLPGLGSSSDGTSLPFNKSERGKKRVSRQLEGNDVVLSARLSFFLPPLKPRLTKDRSKKCTEGEADHQDDERDLELGGDLEMP